jgi:hypothetical protein
MAGRTSRRGEGGEERREGERGRKEGAERDASTAPGLRPGRGASTTTKKRDWVCRCDARGGGVSYSETRHHGVGPSLGSGLRSSAVIEARGVDRSLGLTGVTGTLARLRAGVS